VAQIAGKFLVNGYEPTGCIVNFLHESNRAFVCINFFDVAGASTSATGEFANISAAVIG